MASPWYTYPIDSQGGSYGQIQDPSYGSTPHNYLKPDVNIAVPSGTPITALQSGTVTDVTDHGPNAGGLSVVVALDSPINNLATHVAYNFLGGSNVAVGQHLQSGQQLGVAGSPYGINTAIGLTPDKSWGNGSFNLNATGNPSLDPHLVLGGTGGGGSNYQTLASMQQQTSNVTPCGTQASSAFIIGPLIDTITCFIQPFQDLFNWLANPMRIIKLIIGIVLILASILVFLSPEGEKIGKQIGREGLRAGMEAAFA